MKRFILAVTVLSISTISGLAQTSSSSDPAISPKVPLTYDVIDKDGEPLRVQFKDGREATVFVARSVPFALKAPLTVVANDCTEVIGSACELNGHFAVDKFVLRWSKHPDPKKIGTTVHSRSTPASQGAPEDSAMAHESTEQYSFRDKIFSGYMATAARIPNDFITCKDYRWLPGGTKAEAPAAVKLSLWQTESMTLNPETGMDENRSRDGLIGVTLTRRSAGDGGLEISKVKSAYNARPRGRFDLYDRVMTWTMKNPLDAEYCQLSFGMTLDEGLDPFTEYMKKNLVGEFKPYLAESDDFYRRNPDSAASFVVKIYDEVPYSGGSQNSGAQTYEIRRRERVAE